MPLAIPKVDDFVLDKDSHKVIASDVGQMKVPLQQGTSSSVHL